MTMADRAGRNADYPWERFDSKVYFEHNYSSLREDDREIVELVRDFFADQFVNVAEHSLRGIDVGTGANLYPALTMLPFCESVRLYEYSPRNIEWLTRGQQGEWARTWRWGPFWDLLAKRDTYMDVQRPQEELTRRAEIVQGSVFDLKPSEAGPWDVGTMFFVAESITKERQEFRSAIDHFLNALKPDAPFAIALMEHSKGYHVAGQGFPSTDVGETDVRERLRDRAPDVSINHIGVGDRPLRDGYEGMILALGRVKAR